MRCGRGGRERGRVGIGEVRQELSGSGGDGFAKRSVAARRVVAARPPRVVGRLAGVD